jgi:hypothetical protein
MYVFDTALLECVAFVVRLVSSLKIEKERGRNPSTLVQRGRMGWEIHYITLSPRLSYKCVMHASHSSSIYLSLSSLPSLF